MGTVEVEQAIWKKLHKNRLEHVELARRAHDLQVDLARAEEVIEECRDEVMYLRFVLDTSPQ
jgi:hypothetical protein